MLASSGISTDVGELPETPSQGGNLSLGGDFDSGSERLLKNGNTGSRPMPGRFEEMLNLATLGSIFFHAVRP